MERHARESTEKRLSWLFEAGVPRARQHSRQQSKQETERRHCDRGSFVQIRGHTGEGDEKTLWQAVDPGRLGLKCAGRFFGLL
jgi:hypothetical protein